MIPISKALEIVGRKELKNTETVSLQEAIDRLENHAKMEHGEALVARFRKDIDRAKAEVQMRKDFTRSTDHNFFFGINQSSTGAYWWNAVTGEMVWRDRHAPTLKPLKPQT